MTELYPDFFNDVFGPLMQPGSSSHTAGPCRLGYIANCLLGEEPKEILVRMDEHGSFDGIFGYMSEDIGMTAGALGFLPDDIRMFTSKEICAERGIKLDFEFCHLAASRHPNAVEFVLTGESGKKAVLCGISIGGGMVDTVSFNGYELKFTGDTHLILVFDDASALDHAELLGRLEGIDCMGHGISEREGGKMHWFRVAAVPAELPAFNGLDWALIKPLLPVENCSARKPQLFDTMTKWRQLAEERNTSLYEIAIEYEMNASGWTREQIIERMKHIAKCMHRQSHAIWDEGVKVLETVEEGNHYKQWDAYMKAGDVLCGEPIATALRYAYAARASSPGVLFVPGPMGRGGGFVYSVLCAVKEHRGYSDEDLLRGLFIAGGVCAIAYTRSNPTGEAIGCAGECGVCMAMAAAALAEMTGAKPQDVENAASLAMQSSVGWPCDVIPGGYWQPCGSRITLAVSMAIVYADMARAGKLGVLPFHEVLDVADRIGRSLGDDCHCTGRGGLCTAPTACEYMEAFNKRREQN
ncbi:MAG: L-serine ammonia-lyase, iron-sulfur-dependent, subunit alpha [Oscillospiraceae bacterium]|nr:L-serine ammonia-lyase, iron-sulfur-dependent, subunit alpha [Oscillospiraceae bacterium]